MTPEEKQLLTELNERLKRVEGYTTSLGGSLEFKNLIKTYAGEVNVLSVSSKGASTEDQAINEGGVATYNVMGDPDGFLEVEINQTIYYIPYFS